MIKMPKMQKNPNLFLLLVGITNWYTLLCFHLDHKMIFLTSRIGQKIGQPEKTQFVNIDFK
jgi:hypothetical protein